MNRRMLTSLAAYVVQARDIPLAGQTREAALRCLFDLIVAAAAGHADRGPQAVIGVPVPEGLAASTLRDDRLEASQFEGGRHYII